MLRRELHPEIVYLQTIADCDGHCRYCPFDDVYRGNDAQLMPPEYMMDVRDIRRIIGWIESSDYRGRIGFLLHCEPTLDPRLPEFIRALRECAPACCLEIATNGRHPHAPALAMADVVECVPAGSRTWGTSRAGNARACPENAGRKTFCQPCTLPRDTMPIAANGDVLLCCQDWRHEAVVGTVADLTAARARQLKLLPKVQRLELDICRDCAAGRTAEEVGSRLGKRRLPSA